LDGLVGSPFLNTEVILKMVQFSGNIPLAKENSMKGCKKGVIMEDANLRK